MNNEDTFLIQVSSFHLNEEASPVAKICFCVRPSFSLIACLNYYLIINQHQFLLKCIQLVCGDTNLIIAQVSVSTGREGEVKRHVIMIVMPVYYYTAVNHYIHCMTNINS